MKIAIPVNERSDSSIMVNRFGRALYYLIYELEDDSYTFVENPAANARGGAGIKAVEFLISNGVKAVIAPRVGPNAEQVLRGSNIEIYEGQEVVWSELISKYRKNELNKI
ncbi:MAG: NifB/NifX family molybdenum-iron cluster-binding protein [Candidatus Heimdallarchaeaceae archaeon]